MGEVYTFPVPEKGIPKAYILKGDTPLGEGSRILIDLVSKKYEAVLTKVVKKDRNGNIIQVEYMIPFLSSGDPSKH